MRLKLYILPLLLFTIMACEDEQFSAVPEVHVSEYVDLDHYPELGLGNSITIDNGGYAGLIIYCISFDKYYAYDLCCPKHTEDREQLIVDNERAMCPTDSAIFLLNQGNPAFEYGSATPSILRSYYTTLSNSNVLYVYN